MTTNHQFKRTKPAKRFEDTKGVPPARVAKNDREAAASAHSAIVGYQFRELHGIPHARGITANRRAKIAKRLGKKAA